MIHVLIYVRSYQFKDLSIFYGFF